MRIFRIKLPAQRHLDVTDQEQTALELITLFSEVLDDCRLITFVLPQSLKKLERERLMLLDNRQEEWQRLGILEEVELINVLDEDGGILRTEHYLIDFGEKLTESYFTRWNMKAKRVPKVPLPISGQYISRSNVSIPIQETAKPPKGFLGRILTGFNPWYKTDQSRLAYSIITTHKLKGVWNLYKPFQEMIASTDDPMIVATDIRKIGQERVASSVEFWGGMLNNGADRTAATRQALANAAMMNNMERVHHVQISFMMLAKKPSDAVAKAQSVMKTQSAHMSFDPLVGYQDRAVELFGPNRRPSLPSMHYNTMSLTPALIATTTGMGAKQTTKGMYVGVEDTSQEPTIVYMDGWGQSNSAFHMLIFGLTGRGKTVGVQSLLWRAAQEDTQIIVLEPQGHSRKLAELAGWENVSYNELSYEATTFNPLDVISENKQEQRDHVVTNLEMMLSRKDDPRIFTLEEEAAVDDVLNITYSGLTYIEMMNNTSLTPILEIFVRNLFAYSESAGVNINTVKDAYYTKYVAAFKLANQLQARFVDGAGAGTFNQATNLDLGMKEKIVLFNFKNVPERQRALFYYLVMSGLQRKIRSEKKKKIVFVDETKYMAEHRKLIGFLANLVKTVRTFKCAIWLADQDLETFQDSKEGQMIVNNVQYGLYFGLGRDAALELQRQFPEDLLNTHREYINRCSTGDNGIGRAILRKDDGCIKVNLILMPHEAKVLIGS